MPQADDEDRPTYPDDPTLQHKSLGRLLHRLQHAARAGHPDPSQVLHTLIEETQQHFASEEHAMERAEYPQLDDHCERHAKLLAHLEALREECRRRNILSPAVVDQLHNWFADHELTADADLLAFLGFAS